MNFLNTAKAVAGRRSAVVKDAFFGTKITTAGLVR
jgi:hypothetical protein